MSEFPFYAVTVDPYSRSVFYHDEPLTKHSFKTLHDLHTAEPFSTGFQIHGPAVLNHLPESLLRIITPTYVSYPARVTSEPVCDITFSGDLLNQFTGWNFDRRYNQNRAMGGKPASTTLNCRFSIIAMAPADMPTRFGFTPPTVLENWMAELGFTAFSSDQLQALRQSLLPSLSWRDGTVEVECQHGFNIPQCWEIAPQRPN